MQSMSLLTRVVVRGGGFVCLFLGMAFLVDEEGFEKGERLSVGPALAGAAFLVLAVILLWINIRRRT